MIDVSASRMTALLCLLLAIAIPARSDAGAIAPDTFLQFSFDGAVQATGCDPADPAGAFCIGSSGTPTGILDAPPWVFTAPQSGATLLVTDVLKIGDRFEVFDFGTTLGLTSAPIGAGDCGDDPVVCLGDPNSSKRTFPLAPGNHSITIRSLTDALGTGYLKVTAVPEPATVLAIVIGMLAVLAAGRLRRQRT
jgi:hypothetical protein